MCHASKIAQIGFFGHVFEAITQSESDCPFDFGLQSQQLDAYREGCLFTFLQNYGFRYCPKHVLLIVSKWYVK